MKIKYQKSNIKMAEQRLKIENGSINFYIFICIFTFLFLIFNLSYAFAWQVPLEVATFNGNSEKVYSRLVVGIEPGATGGFDNLWDTPAILSHPDPDKPVLLRAYITSPLIGDDRGGDAKMDRLWKDIRGITAKKERIWDITIDSVPAGTAVVVSWNLPQGVLKAGERLVLRDNEATAMDGTTVQTDLSGISSYVLVSGGEESRSLSLVYSKEGDSRSGGGSGFGCGMVKSHHDEPPDSGTAVWGLLVLLLPLVFVRLTSMRDYLYNLTISHGEDTYS